VIPPSSTNPASSARSATLATPELVATDLDLLERRARELATGSGGETLDRAEDRLVSFRLVGRACAIHALVVERAVARLSRPLSVPLQDGGERLVAFVEERPVPVVDLEGFAAGRPRDPAALESQPALLVTTPRGPVAVAVGGPLELLEDHLVYGAAGGDPAPLRAVGVLAGGTMALDPAWLQEWAGKSARP
jgi:hypothetical protein